jgi:hypothetical protein
MAKTIAITEALKTLKNIENCLKLICQDDRSFFGEWQDPPKLLSPQENDRFYL